MATGQIEEPMDIDDSLYSRQRYVLGDKAMKKMAKSKIFLSGLNGLGVEIAKNITLAGVKELTIHDNENAALFDLSSHFFIRENEIGQNRATICQPRLAELNPYVSVKIFAGSKFKDQNSDLEFLKEYSCVILVNNTNLNLLEKVNLFCRAQNPQICFINTAVFGIFASLFNDFGDNFEVLDKNGEEPINFFIKNVTRSKPGVVTCMENELHGLEDGDIVGFKEVKGMQNLNSAEFKVTVIKPNEFSIGDTSHFLPYIAGGICQEIKKPIFTKFEPLRAQLRNPTILICDLGKFEAPPQIHLAYLTLLHFIIDFKRMPIPRNEKDFADMVTISAKLLPKFETGVVDAVDKNYLKIMADTCQGVLPPLCAAIGGIVAQEALIAVTGKFSPVQQWIHFDCREILQKINFDDHSDFELKGDRYDGIRICLGENLMKKIAELNIFMVGCGAIGCELIKNFALLGASTKGVLTITDDDLIEKSNLNRQFLFRNRHIQKPKSTTAAQSALEINPQIRINAHQNRVGPKTEYSHYTDQFFERQDIIVNALDNVETRMYMDGRCVTNKRPLLESGTMGAKGHVQVIVPAMTECYASQADPPEKDIPYCTLKSFPATIEHCIQWAREKFEALFTQKPDLYAKFWKDNIHPQRVVEIIDSGPIPENLVCTVKQLQRKCHNFNECIEVARVKFEKYFNHKARNLCHAFPDDHKLEDGTPFWSSPKRKPTALEFDMKNELHLSFIVSTAKLLAFINYVTVPPDLSPSSLIHILDHAPVPQWRKSSKKIETDETKGKSENVDDSKNVLDECVNYLREVSSSKNKQKLSENDLKMRADKFEKDDDTNFHIDFISASANLRATMYAIENSDRLKIKKIAGRIVPAIATTTAAVSGFVTLELLKIALNCELEQFRNCFMSLAVPTILFSEPASAPKTQVCDGLSITLWDKWEVKGHATFKIKDFIDTINNQFHIQPTMIVQGVKMVYVPIMPGHGKRLNQPLNQYITPVEGQNYIDLVVTFETSQNEEVEGPPIRYYYK